jgi:MutS-like protein
VARRDREDARLGWGRLAVALAAAALAWLALGRQALHPAWLLLPGAAFLWLVAAHERVHRARARARRAAAFHAGALERLDGRFAGRGTAGERFADPAHPYAQDLDLFGPGSLFELLCAARTRPGEERLAAWLTGPAPAGEVRARQRAVAELTPRLDLREDLAVLGDEVAAGVDAARVAAWGAAPPLLPAWTGPAALSLVAAALGAGAALAAGLVGPLPLVAALLAEAALLRLLRDPVARVAGGVDRPAAELRVLSLVLARLEREPFQEARLRALQAVLLADGAPASRRIAALERLVERLAWSRNQLFAPLGFLLLWRPIQALQVERWRRRAGPAVARWLDAVAELEALSSLAGHAFERPEDPFPEVLDPAPGAPRLQAEGLAHPLLQGAVANDLWLGGGGPRAMLVSGSNMSGKSTWLRTVGVNVVLALAGGTVRARRLVLTPLSVGATLRIQDSLQAGRSRFYAEITRLRQLADLAAAAPPLLFLLDEILHGTNSHDRRVGAEAVLRELLARGAVGLVTTHDLALTALGGAEGAGPGAGGPAVPAGGAALPLVNAHFEDQVVGGQLAFDYLLKPGVVGHSNALALMRAVGLPV